MDLPNSFISNDFPTGATGPSIFAKFFCCGRERVRARYQICGRMCCTSCTSYLNTLKSIVYLVQPIYII